MAAPGTLRELARGRTLPARAYTDPAVFELERELVFRRTWQYAGPAEWVAQPGDHFACRAGHVPLAVVRDEDGALRAFVNVCRHRAHVVVSGRGNRRTLQCPYHAWCYGLDGTLRSAPRADREPYLDMEVLGLLPACAETWGPFVFVNPDPDAAPLADTLGRLPALVADSGLDLGAVRFRERFEWTQPVNWKVAIENDLECYHCPVAHPTFSDLVDVSPDAYRLEVDETFTSQFGPVRDSALEHPGDAPYDARGEVRRVQSHLLFPDVSININPGHPNVGMHLWRPDGHASIAGLSDYYYGADVPDAFVEQLRAFDQQVGAEDAALVASVQEGLDSGMLTHGQLLTESEKLVQHFQSLVARALGDAL